jgi:hypothetical protein
LVVLTSKEIEGSLLQEQISGRGLRSFSLERSVHPLVPTVLLRVSRLDAFGTDAESNPPDRELGEAAESLGGEWRSVVGPHLGLR